MVMEKAAMGRARRSARERDRASGDQTERVGVVEEEGGQDFTLMSIGEGAHTLFKYLSIESTRTRPT
jgi:hypothetical protein